MENVSGNTVDHVNAYELFLESIEKEGISIYWDDDVIDPEDTICFFLDDVPECAVELDPHLAYMSIFMEFGYHDFSRWERENNSCEEEIEEDTYSWLLEQRFHSFLSSHSKHEVSVWDDGCYMCRGYSARVGYQQCECSVEIIREFIRDVDDFWAEYGSLDREKLQNDVIKAVAKKHGFSIKTLPFLVCPKSDVVVFEETLDRSPTIYQGQEYTLVHASGNNSAISKQHWNMVMEIVSSAECYDDISFYSDKKSLSICSATLFFRLPNQNGAEYVEELLIKKNLYSFRPFASGSMNKAINMFDSSFNFPLIFTEGQTDWKHIRHAFEQIAPDILKKIGIHEYEVGIEMGNTELLSMCRSFSKMQNPAPRIMIFDRDDQSINKSVTESGEFKDWGNRVYSLLLPVPPHRKATPNICIEHFYTDDEIKTEHLISGVPRRLFIGYEFDRLGRAPQINKLCRQTKYCGPEKISIIDNGVFDFSETAEVNYALSKSGFAELCSSRKISVDAENAFMELWKSINSVLLYDQKLFDSENKE